MSSVAVNCSEYLPGWTLSGLAMVSVAHELYEP